MILHLKIPEWKNFRICLEAIFQKWTKKSALDAIEEGAKEFVNDLLRLPKPRRKVTAPGYTHLVDSFSYKRDKTGIDVGWGKYYGPMLEHGTQKMSAKAHLKPLFEQKKEKYYKKMIAALDL